MILFAIRKMLKNRWLTFSLLIGYIMATAIVSSMPIYSNAILNRLLTKDLELVQTQNGVYPGRLSISSSIYRNNMDASEEKKAAYAKYRKVIEEDFIPQIDLPILAQSRYLGTDNLKISRAGTDEGLKKSNAVALGGIEGLNDHITLLEGTLPAAAVGADGVIEAMVSEKAAQTTGCALGSSYSLCQYAFVDGKGVYQEVATVKIVGVFTPSDSADLFWTMPSTLVNGAILMDYDLYKSLYLDGETALIGAAEWNYAFDYSAITIDNCQEIADAILYYSDNYNFGPTVRTSFCTTLLKYADRAQQLTATLWIIEIPILLMLLFYIFMVSRLILENEKNEIAVLRSRGSSKSQILVLYLLESALLSAAALAAGPFLGSVFCRIIGASNGFMEFVSRKGLKISIVPEAWLYALITALVLVATMFFSVLFSKESSIVSQKRKKFGRSGKPFWEKLFLDVICLAVAGYGLYTFRNRLAVIRETGAAASDIPVDFLLYASSTLFILGGTLLFLRFFPLLLKLLYRAFQRFLSPVLYLTLSSLARKGSRNLIISLFLMFTISMGIYNSVTVRTLNRNEEDRISYSIGADVVLQEEWPFSQEIGEVVAEGEEPTLYYTEPRFAKYEELDSVEAAARVLTLSYATLTANSTNITGVTLMGIVPDEFGRVAWYRSDLADHHLNEYLNLLATDPRAILVSQEIIDQGLAQPGDAVYLRIPGNKELVQCVIYAGIDYFPSYSPVYGAQPNAAPLVVANLTLLQQETKLSPYEVWIKKAAGATSAQLYAELEEAQIPLASLQDTAAEIISLKNDAIVQGTNGFFTLSFVITMLITLVGFFIYWILAIQNRRLQFGILRSIGLSRFSVVMALMWEQLLVSVTAVVAGIFLGTLTAELFAPILECNVDLESQILPFIVTASPADYLRVICIVGVMLLAAAGVLGRIVYKLRASEALKLGED